MVGGARRAGPVMLKEPSVRRWRRSPSDRRDEITPQALLVECRPNAHPLEVSSWRLRPRPADYSSGFAGSQRQRHARSGGRRVE